FVFLFGLFEFSWYYFQQQLAEMGVRDAARYMARAPIMTGSDSDNPCDQSDHSGTHFSTYAARIAVYGNSDGSGNPRVNGWATGEVTITCPTSPSGTYADGETTMRIISVTTSITGTSFGTLGLLGLTAPPIS